MSRSEVSIDDSSIYITHPSSRSAAIMNCLRTGSHQFESITSHHGLCMINGIIQGGGDLFKHIHTTELSKRLLVLESLRSQMYVQVQFDPRTGQTNTSMCVYDPPGQPALWFHRGVFQLDYCEFCKERISSANDRKLIDDTVQSYKLCIDAIRSTHDMNTKKAKIEEAQSRYPYHCPMSYLILFEEKTMRQNEKYGGIKKCGAVQQLLRDAVSSGRELVTLLKANEFAKGNLYVFVPTRNYCRALYMLGSYLLLAGELCEAYSYFQEYMANDIHDCLGAR